MNSPDKHIVPIELLTKFFAQEANADEIAMVEKWKNSSVENTKEFLAIKKLWNTSETALQKESINVNAEWTKMQGVIVPKSASQFTFKKVLQIAAALLIISSLAFIGLKQTQTTTQKTSIAQVNNILLPDGSSISLNANSKITYDKDFGKTNRNITLKGEGYFEVAKNSKLPFIIKAYDARIEVVGTVFNVKAYKKQKEVKVTVTEGKVKLSESKKSLINTLLIAGETGTYDREKKAIKKQAVANMNDIAWKTKAITFNNTPLHEVVEVLNNTYQVNLIVTEAVKDCTITVEFVEQDLASLLTVLKSTLNLKIHKEDNKYIISGNGC
jgi:ferric-dicitrate binding protein FerR (iron transport regulator)